MAEKFGARVKRPRCNTTSMIDTSCSRVEEQLQHREGGREAWLTVSGSFLVYYASYGLINSFGFFQTFYEKDFLSSTPPSTISLIGTLQIALMNSLATISGAICDVYGVRYLYTASGLGTSVALFVLSSCKPVISQVFICQGVLMGLTMSFGIQPAITIVAQHFEKKRALALGIVCAGSATGGVCFTVMFERLCPVLGFPWTMRIAALKVLACHSVAWSISTSKPAANPIKFGSLVDYKGFLDARYAILAVGGWFMNLGLPVPSYNIKSYTIGAYPAAAMCNYLLPLLNGCSMVGMIVGGLAGDHIGRLNLLLPMSLASGLLCISLWLLAQSLPLIVLFACLFGFTSGTYIALLPTVVSQITPSEKIGARIGAFYSVVAVASLIGAPIGGALIEKDDGKTAYRGLIVYAGATMLIASLVLLGGRLLHDMNLRAKW